MTTPHPVLALTLLLAVTSTASAQPCEQVDGRTLDVMGWNLAMLPTGLVGNGQWSRAAVIPLLAQGHDVLVLSEAFDDDVRGHLLRRLGAAYPYSTRVVGEDGFLHEDGGVILLSRWPIAREAQVVYARRSGVDRLARKGAVYACIEKAGQRWHVFATHTQSGSGQDPVKVAVRAAQLAELRTFMDAQTIATGEPVLVAGDLNIDRGAIGAPSRELSAALVALDAALPAMSGLEATFDPTINGLAEGGGEREFLDYVLVSRRHLAPASATLEARVARSPVPLWLGHGLGRELSDHEPIVARITLAPLAAPVAATQAPGAQRGLIGALGERAR